MAVGPAGWVFLAFASLYITYAAIRAKESFEDLEKRPTRGQMLANVLISHAILLAIALAAALFEEVWLFPPLTFTLKEPAIAAVFLAVGMITFLWRWSRDSTEEKRKILWRMPNQPSDLWGWVAMSMSAGVMEEIFYRGVLFQLWERVLGSFWPAAVLCSIVFALAHYLQGMKAMVVILFIAMAAHWVVRETGSLYTVMAIHFLYDLMAGVLYLVLSRKEGLLSESEKGA